jgi:cell division transport system ATP-binding protein
VIQFDQVVKRYPGGAEALGGISFNVDPGEMVFLTGHSGAGKSTLLKLIMLMERASRGQVLVGGVNLARVTRRQIPYLRRTVGVVFQDHQLLFDRTVFDNVALPLVIAGLKPRDIGRRVRAALSKVHLDGKESQYPAELSGGEQQRVGIARAVANRPPVLLADEPTGNLDPALSLDIMETFKSFNQVGVTVLIATHDISLIEAMGERVLHLDHGRLAQ